MQLAVIAPAASGAVRVAAPNTQICMSQALIGINPISTPNGGSARAYKVLGRSHSVEPGFADLQIPIAEYERLEGRFRTAGVARISS